MIDIPDDEPSVMGAGGGLSPMPLRSEAVAVWRRLYVDRLVERGIDRESAQARCDAGDVDLSVNPAEAADRTRVINVRTPIVITCVCGQPVNLVMTGVTDDLYMCAGEKCCTQFNIEWAPQGAKESPRS